MDEVDVIAGGGVRPEVGAQQLGKHAPEAQAAGQDMSGRPEAIVCPVEVPQMDLALVPAAGAGDGLALLVEHGHVVTAPGKQQRQARAKYAGAEYGDAFDGH